MRLLIVDDSALMREGVRSTVDGYDDVEVVGEAVNGEEAISRTAQLKPDVIVMDVSMPVMDGLSAAEIIKKHYPRTRILMFSMHKIRGFIEIAKNLGLSGYISKEEGGRSLREALDAVSRNQSYFPAMG